MSDFDGRTAVVTGAGSGIGAEIARLLLERGATVVAADVDPTGAPDGSRRTRVDVSDSESVRDLMDRTDRETGRLDILCNNAGIASTSDVVACTVDEWDHVFAVNVRGVFLGMKHAVPHLLSGGGGVIVNTASVAGLVGLRDRAAYCASKGAVISLTKQVAVDYAQQGVRCNCVCPGTVDSPWVERLLAGTDDPKAQRDALIARQPLGRLGTPQEVARAVVYLASDDASFMTGSALVIDGGILAG